MLLDMEQAWVGDVGVVTLKGKLALGRESHRIETMADDFTRQGHRKLLIDLTQVNYVDSAAIGMLSMAAEKLKEAGGKLVLVSSPNGRTTQLLKLTQVNTIVPLFAAMDEAMAALALP